MALSLLGRTRIGNFIACFPLNVEFFRACASGGTEPWLFCRGGHDKMAFTAAIIQLGWPCPAQRQYAKVDLRAGLHSHCGSHLGIGVGLSLGLGVGGKHGTATYCYGGSDSFVVGFLENC